MEFNFEVTKEDYISFNIHHSENSPSQKRNFYILRYLLAIIAPLAIYYIGTGLFKQPSSYWIIIAIAFPIIWIITYPKQYRNLITKEIGKLLNEGDNSEILGNKKMVIEEDSITVYHKSSSEKLSRDAIKDIKIYEDIIVIYTSSINAHIILTRCLDENQADELIKHLHNA